MSRPDSYKEQDGCHSCSHSFLYPDCIYPNEYFCMVDGVPRPLCGSIVISEQFHNQSNRESWNDWSENRSVEAWGICANWSMKKKVRTGDERT